MHGSGNQLRTYSPEHHVLIEGLGPVVSVPHKTRYPVVPTSEEAIWESHVTDLIELHTQRGNLREGLIADKLAAYGHLVTVGVDLAMEDLSTDPLSNDMYIGALKTVNMVDEAIKRTTL
jgi:hypothetical protein